MTASLTIVHTEGSRRWGGQESRVLDECAWMREHGHRPLIAAPAGSAIARKAVALGLEHRPVAFMRSRFPIDVLAVRRVLREVHPHVLNTHGNYDSKVGLVAAIGLDIPLILRTRHSMPPVRPTVWNRLLYWRLCHRVLTTAEGCSRQLIRDLRLPAQRVLTIPTGIRVPHPLPSRSEARRQVERDLALGPQARLIGYVGRLQTGKGLPELVAAFRLLADRVPDCHLVLVGEGPEAEALRGRAVELRLADRVHLVGYQENPWPWYRAFDCHVLNSPEHEGISQALRQAMFAGCPVVATSVGGSAEVIRDGDTGLLVPPGERARLASALEQTLSDPASASERARRAQAFVEAHHTQDHMGRALLAVYARQFPDLDTV